MKVTRAREREFPLNIRFEARSSSVALRTVVFVYYRAYSARVMRETLVFNPETSGSEICFKTMRLSLSVHIDFSLK